jgi:hypothetical protein
MFLPGIVAVVVFLLVLTVQYWQYHQNMETILVIAAWLDTMKVWAAAIMLNEQ